MRSAGVCPAVATAQPMLALTPPEAAAELTLEGAAVGKRRQRIGLRLEPEAVGRALHDLEQLVAEDARVGMLAGHSSVDGLDHLVGHVPERRGREPEPRRD